MFSALGRSLRSPCSPVAPHLHPAGVLAAAADVARSLARLVAQKMRPKQKQDAKDGCPHFLLVSRRLKSHPNGFN